MHLHKEPLIEVAYAVVSDAARSYVVATSLGFATWFDYHITAFEH